MPVPLVSVVLPAYNAEKYLPAALASIRAQSFTDWELIVIDDGSKDRTLEIIQRHGQIESRLRYFHQSNQGLVATLNRGIELARGSLIARMDHDDIAMPDRLARQTAFLSAHPEHLAVSTLR